MEVIINGQAKLVKAIQFLPAIQNSNDLEAGTKTITATAEASGVGNADYSVALTCPAPSDSRLAVLNACARLSFTVDSFNTATILYCRVYVDAQDADHLLIDTSHNAVSNKLAKQSLNATTKATIFNLVKDGAAHTYYFFFWVNQAVNAVISVCQLWLACPGISNTTPAECLRLTFDGHVSIAAADQAQGGTAQTDILASSAFGWPDRILRPGSYGAASFSCNNVSFFMSNDTTNGLTGLARVALVMRSE